MWNDSLVVFHSDNGGEIMAKGICGGNNWPLRGGQDEKGMVLVIATEFNVYLRSTHCWFVLKMIGSAAQIFMTLSYICKNPCLSLHVERIVLGFLCDRVFWDHSPGPSESKWLFGRQVNSPTSKVASAARFRMGWWTRDCWRPSWVGTNLKKGFLLHLIIVYTICFGYHTRFSTISLPL